MDLSLQKLDNLLKANHILSSTLKLSELLRQVMKLATEVVEAETSSLLLYDDKSDELIFDLALGDKEQELKKLRLKLGEGIAGCAAKERKTLIVNDVTSDKRWAKNADAKTQFKTRSVLAVPLLYKENLLGVIEAINKKDREFSSEDAKILEAFAAQAAVSIENARIFERLEQEKGKIEAIFGQMSDGAIFVDSSGKKVMANQSAEKLLGIENIEKNMISDILSDFSSTIQLSDILCSGEKVISAEFSRTKDKSLYLQCVVSRISDSKGNALGSIFIFRDTTSDKKESFLKTNFLSLISHKLRTPLVSITGYSQMLSDDVSLDEFHKKAAVSINRQGKRLAGLMDKLLYFTMAENEKLNLGSGTTLFSQIADKAISVLYDYIKESSADVVIDEKVKVLPGIKMDYEKMEIVLRNLIENAIKFNKSGKKNVRIEPVNKDNFIGLAVIDNGPGIPPEERDKIFQKFYQIEDSFTGQVEGPGLGLSLVKHIVEAHKGYVGVESAFGKGSKFYFLLPAE